MELVTAVEAAAAGDERAWNELVERFSGLVWSVARSFRLDPGDAADVVQATWLRLVEHLGEIRQPERIGGWLATTARRECLRVLRARERELIVDLEADQPVARDPSPEDAAVLAERDALLWQALAAATPRCRRLLRLLAATPPPSYAEVSAALDMPVGSIGPTRARCLECLRRHARGLGLDTPALAPA